KIFADSRAAFSWAMANDILKAFEGDLLKPQDPVDRLWTVNAIGKLLDNHVCMWGEWTDNGDGTHTRVCSADASHKETKEHAWNDGELTVKPTQSEKGLVTYTCTACKLTKTEEVAAGTEFVTRADLEEALVNTAFAYSAKGTKIQYDSTHLTVVSPYLGGLIRMMPEAAPEVSTKHNTLYSVCSNFTHMCYHEALGIPDLGEGTWSFGYSTANIFKLADNQINEQIISSQLFEPRTEKDVRTSLFRWTDFDAYKKHQGETNTASFVTYGVFDEPSFTDYTEGLTFKDDGFEGEVHYSYYDRDGKRLGYDEVRKNYLDPFIKAETTLRPGDLLVNHNHVMVYVGNDRLVHCVYPKGAGKLDTKTGIDKIEPDGAIFSHTPLGYYAYSDATMQTSGLMAFRPLEFVVKAGYDADPGNDIVKDLKIPEKTKSRIKYPMMDIDRTVDITHFGTAVSGENLTYTVEISNRTNEKNYGAWKGADALQDYEKIAVTETIPAGCEYVPNSATNGGEYKDGVIRWNVEKIAPGESVTLSYSVKVTAEVGTVIENGGGTVDNIPSNRLRNTVGSAKLSDAAVKELASLSGSGSDALKTFGDGTAFANAIYRKIGAELSLPSIEDIAKTLFPLKKHTAGEAPWFTYPASTKIHDVYENKSQSPDVSSPVKEMIVDRFWGGRRFYVGDALKW
ncbi:MAG: DUF11 domain-containing protein, partial [Oscillospiraceae bacterium]|nr:DUF11 domain-containing protein [Oscillospiraceae bacterium]